MKELIKSAVFFTSLLGATSASATLMVNADVTVFQKTEFGHVYVDDNYETYYETSDVAPRSANLLLSFNIENSDDVRAFEYDEGDSYSFEYIWGSVLNPISAIGPFQDELMQLLIPENYDDSYEVNQIITSSALRKNTEFTVGQNDLQFSVQYTATRDIWTDNTVSSSEFSYGQTIYFSDFSFIESIEDLKLTDKASILDFLFENQKMTFTYEESVHLSNSMWDSETWDLLSSDSMSIRYEGIANINVTKNVPEPGMIALALLALGGIFRKRVR